jgi:hypothetical protein
MKTPVLALASTALALAAFFHANSAHALGPVDIEVGLKGGYATDAGLSPNPYGFGLGGRAGISVVGIYGGVSGMYYFGGSQQVAAASSVSTTSAMEGGELGYTFKLSVLKLRPQLGLGNVTLSGSGSANVNGQNVPGSNSLSYLYLEPTGVVLISLGLFYVGADAGVIILPSGPSTNGTSSSSSDTSFCAHGQLGIQF